jgi:probable HAF family extracellular repeat protein
MQDIGTLGGTIGYPWWMNSHGQVVGQSNLAGDVDHHPFLWERGRLTDLGTLGGHRGAAYWINEVGEATGNSRIAGDAAFHATLWKDGRVIDLGTLPGYPFSVGFSINLREQVVGYVTTSDFSVLHAALWEQGNIIDLNNYVPQGSGITLIAAYVINEDGEIVVQGTDSNGDNRVYLLHPCGD